MDKNQVSPQLLNLIKEFEGFREKAYQDIVGTWTIGYGTTGPEIVEGLVWTKEKAALVLDVALTLIRMDIQKLTKASLTDNQLDALTSFVYNLGLTAYLRSTLKQCLEAGDTQKAADEFLRWSHAGGKTVLGLVRRRKAERALFLS